MNPLDPQIEEAWYIACQSSELGKQPLKRRILGKSLVLFRDSQGNAGALVDRCIHRGIPLSKGCVKGNHIQCAYHGWEYDAAGHCKRVPALLTDPDVSARKIPAHALIEQQGFVWVYGVADQVPESKPWHFQYIDDPSYLTVVYEVRAPASVHAIAENALDVPHTAFLHAGLFRNDAKRSRISCEVKRYVDRVQCQYIGEDRPEGLVGRILSPSGGEVTHFDRFYLPSIVEVEYSIGPENHIIINGACTPVGENDTRMFSVTALRTRLPGWLIRPFVMPLALRIFEQDRIILGLQTDTTADFGEPTYVSTDVDLVGPHILKLMNRAAKGQLVDANAEPWSTTIEMEV